MGAQEHRVLVLSDWVTDAEEVADRVVRLLDDRGRVTLVVPARLAGLDWIGDPYAAVPCAQAHVEALGEALSDRNVALASADVADPSATQAATDAVLAATFDQVVVIDRRSAMWPRRFRLASRVARLCACEVTEVLLGAATSAHKHCSSKRVAAVPQLNPG
jgi:hypothetical protein